MKNKNLFLYLAGVLTLISCGTASHASYSGSKYQNGIYYTPDANAVYAEAKNQEELKNLQGKTKTTFKNSTQQSTFDTKTGVETIYVGDTNLVNIQYNPNVNYSVVDDNESYESRLRKFDSPTYTININLEDNNYYPWWDVNFGWYRPYGMTMGTGWYNPWWGSYYSWYGPSYWNRWYGPNWGWNNWYSWHGGYYDPWFDPWYGPGYYPGYYPGHWPSHRPSRDVYYGRRDSSPSYNNRPGMNNGGGSYTRRQPGINQIRGNNNGYYTGRNENNSQQAGNTGGSSYRRGNSSQGYNGAVYNNGVINKGSGSSSNQGQGYRPSGNNNNNNNSQGSMYRRSATRTNSSTYSNSSRENNNQTYRNNGNNNTNNTYNQNTYNRGSSTRSTGSSFSTGSSYSGSSSGTTSGGGTSGGGSSYRRR